MNHSMLMKGIQVARWVASHGITARVPSFKPLDKIEAAAMFNFLLCLFV